MASSLLQSWRLPPCVQVPPRCRWKTSLSTRQLIERSIRHVPSAGPGMRLLELLPSLSISCRRCLHQTATATAAASSSHRFSHHHHSVTVDVGDSPLTFSTGKYVKLADGAILVQSGETSVMVTAVSEKHSSANSNYTPLVVDYRERYSASNKIPRTFFRRELRATSSEVIVSRYIDRSIRPLFPPGYTCNTQVICNMLALDRHHDPEILSINGASAALAVSDIPWNGPIGAVRIGLIDNQFHINPSRKMLASSKLNLIVASTADRIMMVEGSALEVSEEQFCEAVNVGFKEAQPLIASLVELQQAVNNRPREVALNLPPQEIVDLARDVCGDNVKSILLDSSHKKLSRDNLLFATLDDLTKQVGESHPSISEKHIGDAFWGHVTKEAMRSVVLDNQTRCDGRGMRELRPISCEVDVFKPLHGCSIFTRGETQVFCSVTFDSLRSAYRPDLLSLILGGPKNQTFMVHYEFPPFAINSTGRFLGMDRREIGHGCLAEKALAPLMPANYPFTIRINSQVLESNGSSSMATVCAGSLALFDAGVPMPHAVAGVACGLFTRIKPDSQDIDQYQILSDINGIEDAIGNMDFKISGTRNGITSIQVDIKDLSGIPFHIFEEAVMQSRDARYGVLDKMDETMSLPREGIKEHGPVYSTIDVPSEKRGRLFGVGGHRIKTIVEETDIVLEGVDEQKLSIFAPSQEAMDEAMEKIDTILNEETKPLDIPIGSVIEVTIRDIREYGFIAELAPGVQCLLHIQQFSHDFTAHPLDSGIRVGDKINVKFLGQDTRGHYLISRKALLPPPVDRQQPPHSSRIRVPTTSPTTTIEQNFDKKSLSSVSSHRTDSQQKTDRELLNPSSGSHMPDARENFDREMLSPETSHIPALGTEQSIDKELPKSKMAVTPPHMPDSELNSSSTELLNLPSPPSPTPSHPSSCSVSLSPSPSSSVTPTNQVNESRERSSVSGDDSTTTAAAVKKFKADLKRLGVRYGEVIQVTITEVLSVGCRVQLPSGSTAFLSISQISRNFITHPSESGLKVGDKIPVVVLGPDRQGRPSLSRKLLLPRLSDSGDSDDDNDQIYKPAADDEKRSTCDQAQSLGNIDQAVDDSTTAEGCSSQPASDDDPVSSSSKSDSTTITQPVGDSGGGGVSDSSTVTQVFGDTDPTPKTVRTRLRSLYDRWFSPNDADAAKQSSSPSTSDDVDNKSNSKTRE